MNKRYIDYANYNIWANNKLINNLLKNNDGLLSQKIVASFPSIRATIIHMWFAETGWLSCLNGNTWEANNVKNFAGSNKELFKCWQITSQNFKDFVEQNDLQKEVTFDSKGESFSIPKTEVVQTVFNHGSFHRGQVVMMMRQLGITDIMQTDYIEWVREHSKGKCI
jgi:uncharacterized damage-inducible protein DinB